MSVRAFIVGGRGILGGCPLNAWLDAGHQIVDYWTTDLERERRDNRFVDLFCPEFSTMAALERARVTPKYYADQGGAPALTRAVAAASPDVLISIGFGRRLKNDLLSSLPNRCFNLHPALLPICRGPAPILGLLFDDRMSDAGGMTLHLIDDELDTGAIVGAIAAPPDPTNNPLRYHVQTARLGARLLVELLPKFLSGNLMPRRQNEDKATFRRLSRNDLVIRPDMDIVLAERLARTVPWISRLNAEVSGRLIPVDGVITKLRPDSGASSWVGLRSVEMKLNGGRLRLRRRTAVHRLLWKWRRMSFLFNA